ncbi:unnamed protein product [Amoebophrya sp. A120]|nr:unnamed protein product [Amoebophrya sp. A120]|eukprot:GSA120T00004440001.1
MGEPERPELAVKESRSGKPGYLLVLIWTDFKNGWSKSLPIFKTEKVTTLCAIMIYNYFTFYTTLCNKNKSIYSLQLQQTTEITEPIIVRKRTAFYSNQILDSMAIAVPSFGNQFFHSSCTGSLSSFR